MRFSRRLLIALLLSAAVHLALLSDGDWLPSVPSLAAARLQPLRARLMAQKLAAQTPQATAEPAPPARPDATQVGFPAPQPVPKRRHGKHKQHRAAQASAPQAASAAVAQDDSSAPANAAAASAGAAEASVPMRPASAPAVASAVPPAPVASAPAAKPLGNGGQGAVASARFPERVRVRYQLSYNGIPANGQIRWNAGNGRYHLELELSALFVSLRYESTGSLGPRGLRPEHYQAWRGSNARESASFDWNGKLLGYGDGNQQQVALEPDAQDLLSLAWQLAVSGGAEEHTNVQVTNGKRIYHYPVKVLGEGNYPGEGGLPVVVFRAESADNKTEFWLARNYFNLPVRIVFQDDQKTIRLNAIQIQVNGQSVWPLQ